MLEKAEKIRVLITKYLKEELSVEERETLDKWVNQSDENRELFRQVSDKNSPDLFYNGYKEYLDIIGKTPEFSYSQPPAKMVTIPSNKRSWYMAAASVALIVVITGYIFIKHNRQEQELTKTPTPEKPFVKDVDPAGNKATLQLSNGKKITLTDAGNGMLAQDGKTIINKKQDGELVYEAGSVHPGTGSILSYNTITTPRGGKYQVVLPDGSKVWLNAASALRFPIAFSGKERKVELSGEAYFEVIKDKSKPFIVALTSVSGEYDGSGEIEVLGTHFNVNAYEEEPKVSTTLLEGSIKFSASAKNKIRNSKVLTPGQQAVVNKNANDISIVTTEDPEASIAWVNGKFSFEKTNLTSVMRELSRWYNIQVTYEGNVETNTLYTGKVDRMIPLSRLLSNLEKIGDTKFKVEVSFQILSTPLTTCPGCLLL
jgi:transmembrane sensor